VHVRLETITNGGGWGYTKLVDVLGVGLEVGGRFMEEESGLGLGCTDMVGRPEGGSRWIPRRALIAGDARVAVANAVSGLMGMSAVGRDGGLQDLRVRPEDLLELVEALLELPAIACSKARLPPLLVLAGSAVAAAPAT
jgi:hypothetical protein